MIKTMLLVLGAVAALLGSSCALAQVSVSGAWARATVTQQTAGGAFLRIASARDARLVAVRSPVAATVEIHQMQMDGQMMRMHAVDGIDLPAGKTVTLGAGGYHIMLLGLKHPLKEGDTIPMTLVVQGKDKKTENVEVSVPVKPLTYVAN